MYKRPLRHRKAQPHGEGKLRAEHGPAALSPQMLSDPQHSSQAPFGPCSIPVGVLCAPENPQRQQEIPPGQRRSGLARLPHLLFPAGLRLSVRLPALLPASPSSPTTRLASALRPDTKPIHGLGAGIRLPLLVHLQELLLRTGRSGTKESCSLLSELLSSEGTPRGSAPSRDTGTTGTAPSQWPWGHDATPITKPCTLPWGPP